MERKFELAWKHTVWSIVGCRRTNFGEVALWKLHTTRQKTQNCSWASSTLFSPSKSTAMKREIKLDCYETGYTCWHILLRARNGKELIQSGLWTGSLFGEKFPPRGDVFVVRTEEHQNPSKTAEKMVLLIALHFRWLSFSLHTGYTSLHILYTSNQETEGWLQLWGVAEFFLSETDTTMTSTWKSEYRYQQKHQQKALLVNPSLPRRRFLESSFFISPRAPLKTRAWEVMLIPSCSQTGRLGSQHS